MVGIPDRFPYVVYQLAQTTAVHTVDLMVNKFNKYIAAGCQNSLYRHLMKILSVE